jgi:alpha-beta hydrolase superfamily lysophospholipase
MESILIVLAILYIVISLAFYLFQHYFFFRPEILPKHFTYKYPFPFEELNFEMEDGGNINAIYFKVPKSRGIVFYLKGNSRSIKGWGKFAKDFLSNGNDFIMMDYRGFGKSRGKRNQATLFNDAQYVYQWISESYEADKIILYGRSLGSGIAARIASWNKPRLLILDSPYLSFYHNIQRYLFLFPVRWMLRYDLRTDQYMKDIICPVHIIHGTKDRLIPFNQSEQLKALFPEKVSLHAVQGAHHNNLPDYPTFYRIIYDILYIKPDTGWQL